MTLIEFCYEVIRMVEEENNKMSSFSGNQGLFDYHLIRSNAFSEVISRLHEILRQERENG